MKGSIYTISIILCLAAISSCSSEIMTYNGEPGIYFAMPTGDHQVNSDTTYTSSSSVPFIVEDENVTELTFILKVKIMGTVSDKDRHVAVRIVDNETDVFQEDYDPLQAEYTIKAGSVFGNIPIVFHRSPSLKGMERTLTLELLPNDDFSLPIARWKNSSTEYVDVVKHSITVSDKYVQLPGYMPSYFGPFSEKKMDILINVAKIVTLDELKDKMSYVRAKSLGQQFDRWLKTQKPPVLEEDGTPMTAGEYIYTNR